MSDLSIRFDDYEDEDIFDMSSSELSENKKNEGKTDRVAVAVKIIVFILAFCVFLEFLFYKFIIPSTTSPMVSVQGQVEYSAESIVGMLRPMNIKTWYGFDVEAATSIIASASGIDSVQVRKVFPNKIYINVKEREAVAMTFIEKDGRSIALQIDKNGFLFPETSRTYSMINSVPIISGLPVEHMSEGMRIPLKYRTLIEQVSQIRSMQQNYFAAISEICVVPKDSGSYELVLIPVSSKIRVLTDRTLNEDALKYMMVVLDVVNSIEPDVSEIDLRYGSVSYRKR